MQSYQSQNTSIESRNQVVETLRGLAIIMLVAHHVIGTNAGMGLRIEDGFYRTANDLSDHLRMPLFAILSGFSYALRPFLGDTRRFLKGKFRRLILPMLIVGTVFAVMQAATPSANGSVQNWWLLHILPVSYFWFVESLFIIFALMVLLESFSALDTFPRLLIVWFVSLAVYLSPLDIPYFSVSGAFYLMPFFLAGMAVARYAFVASGRLKLCIALVAVCLALYGLADMGFISLEHKRSLGSLAIALSGCLALIWLAPVSPTLAKLGTYSYSIYLYHVFFSAAVRIFGEQIGVGNVHLLFVTSLAAGLLAPIALDKLFNLHPTARLALLGKTTRAPALGKVRPVAST